MREGRMAHGTLSIDVESNAVSMKMKRMHTAVRTRGVPVDSCCMSISAGQGHGRKTDFIPTFQTSAVLPRWTQQARRQASGRDRVHAMTRRLGLEYLSAKDTFNTLLSVLALASSASCSELQKLRNSII